MDCTWIKSVSSVRGVSDADREITDKPHISHICFFELHRYIWNAEWTSYWFSKIKNSEIELSLKSEYFFRLPYEAKPVLLKPADIRNEWPLSAYSSQKWMLCSRFLHHVAKVPFFKGMVLYKHTVIPMRT